MIQPTKTTAVVLLTFVVVALPLLIALNHVPSFDPLAKSAPKTQNDTATADSGPKEQYFINFGDSFSRSGFKYEKCGPDSKENPRPDYPMGNPTWPGVTSTGGPNWVGYMVTEFNTTTAMAYNFASSGSKIDNAITGSSKNPSFVDQVGFFKKAIGDRPKFAPWTADNMVAGMWWGVNDVRVSRGYENVTIHLEKVIERLFETVTVLYDTGVRKFVFLENPPLSLLPHFQRRKDTGDFDFEKTMYASDCFARGVREGLPSFKAAHPDVTASIVKTADIFYNAFLHPEDLDAEDAACIDRKGVKCLWWDKDHPAQRIHRLIGERVAKAAWGQHDDIKL